MTAKSNSRIHPVKAALMAALATTTLFAGMPDASAAGYTVQSINSPGPAIRMSGNGAVTGFFVAKCSTINGYERFTYCYNAPWLFDGKSVIKLTNKFGSTANAQAVAINDSLELVGADINGAWFYSGGTVIRPGGTNTRLFAVNNNHVAVGMSSFPLPQGYQPATYTYLNNAGLQYALSPGMTAVDINDVGMIAGWYKSGTIEQSFISVDGVNAIGIPNLDPSINCRPVRISQVNQTTGQVWVAGNCAENRPFLYEFNSGTLTELSFPGSSNLSVVAVNSQGVAVGTAVKPGAYAPDGYTAILWPAARNTSPIDLNATDPINGTQAFAPASTNGVAWNVHSADINDAGTVLTGYNDTSGNFYTFELHPIP